MLRITYFLCFECICGWSIIFVDDELKVKVDLSREVVNNMDWLRKKCFKIYEKSVRFADVTEEEKKKMEEARLAHPDEPEKHEDVDGAPKRMMIDLKAELYSPEYSRVARGVLEKFKRKHLEMSTGKKQVVMNTEGGEFTKMD